MHKKLAAILTIAIFAISTLAIVNPVSAHFTLGDLTGTYRYHANDFDPHTGLIGYVWPGGGDNAYTGTPGPGYASVNMGPGYQSPYPGGKPPNAASPSWYQLEGNAYAPFGAILTDSTGDLIFAINSTTTTSTLGWDTWLILIPPGFGGVTGEQVVSTVTNNYANIVTGTVGASDRYAPGWTYVAITADQNTQHQFINFTSAKEWYYARVNGVKAPSIAGRYFFKMALYGNNKQLGKGSYGEAPTQFIPVENWPVMLVKGEIDPAIITGTIRYAGYNATLYGKPIQEAGMVWAKMTTKLDPYTGQKMTGAPTTDAVGYFNSTASGHYEVEGLAPGVYDVYASAAGYPQALIASSVTVLKGQSLHFDGYLQPGPVIHGNVFTKHQFGDEPWPNTAYIKIELYANPTVSHIPDASAGAPVSWSPLPCVAAGSYSAYYPYRDAHYCSNGVSDNVISFPWHEYKVGTTATGDPITGVVATGTNPYGQDPMGVGPKQIWHVTKGTTTPFHFEFGLKGEYGAPSDLSGLVPQIYATWINGLTPGRYYARAWVFRYVQSGLDGSTFQEYSFDVTPNEWAGDVTLPIDLRLSSWVNKTVHFHNLPGTLIASSINTGAAHIYGDLEDANGVIWAYNITGIPLDETLWPNAAHANGGSNDAVNPINKNCNTPGFPEFGSCNIQLWGINDTWSGENYGIPSGTYTPKIWVEGYSQQTTEQVSVTLSGTPTQVSDHMYRGAGFNFSVYSIDWERPRVSRNWVWPGAEIDINAYQNDKMVMGFGDWYGFYVLNSNGAYQDSRTDHITTDGGGRNVQAGDNANMAWFGNEAKYQFVGGYTSGSFIINKWKGGQPSFTAYQPTHFESGQYDFRGLSYGYVQSSSYPFFSVYAQKGQVADIKINLVIGVNITLDILFKKESIITRTANNMSARVRVFDDSGKLVAEWMSSEGVYATATGNARAADGTCRPGVTCVGGGITDHDPLLKSTGDGVSFGAANPATERYTFGGGKGSMNYLPGGVRLLHVLTAGLPAITTYAVTNPIANLGYTGNGYWGDPVFAGVGNDFEGDVQDFGQASTHYFHDYGILGASDYTGGWTAEVDFVNWYKNNTSSPQYYPPTTGLLLGESFHIIPGTTATSSISLTEDGALSTTFLGHSMAPNHLGPYSQQGVWSINNAHNSGEASAIFEVDLNGLVSGSALAFSWSSEFRPVSWATVSVVGATGTGAGEPFTAYTYDGRYEFYLTPGNYKMTISIPGATEQTASIAVTPGQSTTGQNFYLERNNIPVPEFSGIAVVAFSALAASLYLLRRRRK